jgi:hypothetical protein
LTPTCRQKVLLPIEFQMLMAIPSAAERLPSDMLIDIALCEELFHTATGTAFCRYHYRGPSRNLAHSQQTVSGLVAPLLLPGDRGGRECSGDQVSARPVRSVGAIRRARARGVHIRIAEHTGHIYLDLADECWRAVEIAPEGWRVVEYPPVRFRRPVGMLPPARPRTRRVH